MIHRKDDMLIWEKFSDPMDSPLNQAIIEVLHDHHMNTIRSVGLYGFIELVKLTMERMHDRPGLAGQAVTAPTDEEITAAIDDLVDVHPALSLVKVDR